MPNIICFATQKEHPLFSTQGGKLSYVYIFLEKGKLTTSTLQYKATKSSSGMGIGLMGGLGYVFTPNIGIRAELEYVYRPPNKIAISFYTKSTLSTQSYTILINSYINYYINQSMNIYAGFGLGAGIIVPELHHEPTLYHSLKANLSFV